MFLTHFDFFNITTEQDENNFLNIITSLPTEEAIHLLNQTNQDGDTVFLKALSNGRKKILRFVVDQALSLSDQDNVTIETILARQTAFQPVLTQRDPLGRTALSIIASQKGSMDAFDLLWNTGQFSLSDQDAQGNTPLMWAIYSQHADMVVHILSLAINRSEDAFLLTQTNKYQQNPLQLSFATGNRDITILLLSHSLASFNLLKKEFNLQFLSLANQLAGLQDITAVNGEDLAFINQQAQQLTHKFIGLKASADAQEQQYQQLALSVQNQAKDTQALLTQQTDAFEKKLADVSQKVMSEVSRIPQELSTIEEKISSLAALHQNVELTAKQSNAILSSFNTQLNFLQEQYKELPAQLNALKNELEQHFKHESEFASVKKKEIDTKLRAVEKTTAEHSTQLPKLFNKVNNSRAAINKNINNLGEKVLQLGETLEPKLIELKEKTQDSSQKLAEIERNHSHLREAVTSHQAAVKETEQQRNEKFKKLEEENATLQGRVLALEKKTTPRSERDPSVEEWKRLEELTQETSNLKQENQALRDAMSSMQHSINESISHHRISELESMVLLLKETAIQLVENAKKSEEDIFNLRYGNDLLQQVNYGQAHRIQTLEALFLSSTPSPPPQAAATSFSMAPLELIVASNLVTSSLLAEEISSSTVTHTPSLESSASDLYARLGSLLAQPLSVPDELPASAINLETSHNNSLFFLVDALEEQLAEDQRDQPAASTKKHRRV